jgi:hypothetical protein
LKESMVKAVLGLCKFGLGVLVLVLFRWTPQTAKGILIYLALFAVLIIGAIGMSSGENTGYWPKKPEDQ